jgi:hypothetical protein
MTNRTPESGRAHDKIVLDISNTSTGGCLCTDTLTSTVTIMAMATVTMAPRTMALHTAATRLVRPNRTPWHPDQTAPGKRRRFPQATAAPSEAGRESAWETAERVQTGDCRLGGRPPRPGRWALADRCTNRSVACLCTPPVVSTLSGIHTPAIRHLQAA